MRSQGDATLHIPSEDAVPASSPAVEGQLHLTKDSRASQPTARGICLRLSRKPPNSVDSSTARLPTKFATAVDGLPAPARGQSRVRVKF